jgi:two-component sensor histidine kinase/tetratricopeptide (TPR) repeat protein
MYYDYADQQQLTIKTSLVERSIDAFEQTNDLISKARSFEMLGDLYSQTDDVKAIPVLKHALAIYDSIKYPRVQGVYVLLGSCYNRTGDYGQSLSYLLKALRIAQAIGDSSMQLCQINYNVGNIYDNIYKWDIGLKYLQDAIEIAKKHDDDNSIFLVARDLAVTYNNLEKPDLALQTLGDIPKKYARSPDPHYRILIGITSLTAYLKLHEFQKAQPYCDTLVKFADEGLTDRAERRSSIYRLAGIFYFFQKKYIKAHYYLAKSIDVAEKTNFEFGLIEDLRLSYRLDSAEKNFQSAFNHLLLYQIKSDSVNSEKRQQQFAVMAVEYEVGNKEDSIQLQNRNISLLTQKNNLQQANLRQAGLIKNITIAGIILAFIIIALLYRQYRQKQKSNQQLEQQQAQINKQNTSLQNLVKEQNKLINEKEWLIKEIHHRVKNNLQIVMSLLNSQSAYINNEPALTAIHDSQHRVHAMSLIHQKLYGSENVSTIDISVYIRELVSYLADSFDTGQRIRFEYNIEPLEMDVSQAVPLGLILNEAITNSIKYAFPDNRSGAVSISLSNKGINHYLLTISDNGIGILSNFGDRKIGSLGMSLMQGLAEDLDGKLLIENNNGTAIKISFVHNLVRKPGVVAEASPVLNN